MNSSGAPAAPGPPPPGPGVPEPAVPAHASRGAGGRPRTAAGRWLARRTLRGRLVAGLLALLFLACASIGALTYAHLHSVLIGGLNTELADASQRYVNCIHPPGDHDQSGPGGDPPAGDSAFCSQQQGTGVMNIQFNTGGSLVAKNIAYSTDGCRLSKNDEALLTDISQAHLQSTSQPQQVDLSAYGRYQVVTRPLGDGQVLLTGMPLAPVDTTLRQVALAEIAVFSLALVLTGLLGTAWVRVSLRPLRRVAATATRVTQLPLASGEVSMPERVPDADPRTEVGQVGAAFNRMLGHVESALARREASEGRLRSFAADASHELRTPLAAIRGYAELARRSPDPLPAEVAHALSRVEAESARMSLLVDELLLLAQLDAGRPLAGEPVDLTRLAIDVTSDARAASADHRWQLELPDEPVIVRGDEHRLHQVLANLLSNASRHTPAGTVVTVAVSASGGTAVVSVTDNGPGIPAELQPAVFERFVRGDTSRSRAAGSSGLGLAIVHAVAAAHGGRADVVSRPGETRFTITLPDGQPPQ
jgi:two-component system, OmpR family, sensor kinase